MKNKIIMSLFGAILLLGGCQPAGDVNNAESPYVSFENISDIIPYTIEDKAGSKKNILIDKNTKEIKEVVLPNMHFEDIFAWGDVASASQYYTDRLILGGSKGRGVSIELAKDDSGNWKINEYNFNIVYYDEAQKKYITETTEKSEKQGLHILNENLEVEDFITVPVPVTANGDADDQTYHYNGTMYAYNLDTILYVSYKEAVRGDTNYSVGPKFQVKKYNRQVKKWDDITEFLPEDNDVLVPNVEYNSAYPEWAAFITGIKSDVPNWQKEKSTDRVTFVNLKTGEMKSEILPFFLQSKHELPVYRMPVTNVSTMFTGREIGILDINPTEIKVLEKISLADLDDGHDFGKQILQYDDNGLVFSTYRGVVKYSFQTKTSEYLYKEEKPQDTEVE